MHINLRLVVAWVGMTCTRQKNVLGVIKMLYLDCGGDYMVVYNCLNSCNLKNQ